MVAGKSSTRLMNLTLCWIVLFTLWPAAVTKAKTVPFTSPQNDDDQVDRRDKRGTTARHENKDRSQGLADQQLASSFSFEAEGTGLEPATGFPAPHFQ